MFTGGGKDLTAFDYGPGHPNTDTAVGADLEIYTGLDAYCHASGMLTGVSITDVRLQRTWAGYGCGTNHGLGNTGAKFLDLREVTRGRFLDPRRRQADPGMN